jgi:methionine sulfoxide reductase catalytic subunit
MICWLGYLIVHVTLVVLTGFERNMNHIVLGTDNLEPLGMILGFVGLGVVFASWIAAHHISWKLPRLLQHTQGAISLPVRLVTLNRLRPRERYTKDQISPHFWPNVRIGNKWRRAISAILSSRLAAW